MSPAGDQLQDHLTEHATCLGCGCTCDDIAVRVRGGRIVEAAHACSLGIRWFGDGLVPSATRVNRQDVTLDAALEAVQTMLAASSAPLVYVAPELSCETQREAVALADLLHATLDTISSTTALNGILAAQERGRAGATLGEIRNRADVMLFWGVDPAARYPRYGSRYAPDPAGLHVADGRRSRSVIAVDVGNARGPADADVRVAVGAGEEVALLTAIAAIVRQPGTRFDGPLGSCAADLAARLIGGRYTVIVADGEPPDSEGEAPAREPQRAAALIALAQALNGPTRCALSTLRAGGNRSGAEAVLTAHTGYPTGVAFTHGFPVYRPFDAVSGIDAALIVGDAAHVPPDVRLHLTRVPLAIIGPRASAHAPAAVTIDTGVAGIHSGGTVLRMDDVPLPLRPSLDGPPDAHAVMRALNARVAEGLRSARSVSAPGMAAGTSPVR